MNTCGLDHPHICSKFIKEFYNCDVTETNLNEIVVEWYFSEYYHILCEYNIKTPYSEIVTMNDLLQDAETINERIKQFPNSCVFARTDSCSSKPDCSFSNVESILDSLSCSERTKDIIKSPNCKIILRNYIQNIGEYYEFRCFVHSKKFRAMTSSQPIKYSFKFTPKMLIEIYELIDKVVFYTDYEMCSIDIIIHQKTKEIMVLEINTPVWLCATSGLFDLTVPFDYNVLLGEYNPDVISYPVIRIQYE
jgi:D123